MLKLTIKEKSLNIVHTFGSKRIGVNENRDSIRVIE